MKKYTMVKLDGKFYEFVGELFGRTYYKDGEEVKTARNEDVIVYTEEEYRKALDRR